MAVLLLYSFYFAPKRVETPPPGAVDVPPTQSAVTPTAAESDVLPSTSVDEAGDFKLDSSSMVVTFSNIDGLLTQVELRGHASKGEDGGFVKLVPAPSRRLDDTLKEGGVIEVLGKETFYRMPDYPLRMEVYGEAASGFISDQLYQVVEGIDSLTFRHRFESGIELAKTYRLGGRNLIDFEIDIEIQWTNYSDEPLEFGTEQEPGYRLYWQPGVENPELREQGELFSSFLMNGDYQEKPARKVKGPIAVTEADWIGQRSRYFLAAFLPDPETDNLLRGEIRPIYSYICNSHPDVIREGPGKCPLDGKDLTPTPNLITSIESDYFVLGLGPGATHVDRFRLYVGPRQQNSLRGVDPKLTRAVYFGMLDPLGQGMLAFMRWIHNLYPNWGIAIIALTFLVRFVSLPLTQKGMDSMKKMQALQPQMQELKEKYKDKPQELNQKMAEFMKEHHVNPMGGCLPMLIQMPIFIALFSMLRNAFELRDSQFLFWINDLSAPDTLFTFPFSLPVIGNGFHFLPIAMAGAMFLQQKMAANPMAKTNDPTQKMLKYMPLIFGFICYSMPSGLSLYILAGTLFSMVQQVYVKKAGKGGAPAFA